MRAGGIFGVALTAVVLFAATNVDDIVMLTVLSITSRAEGRPRRWHVWAQSLPEQAPHGLRTCVSKVRRP